MSIQQYAELGLVELRASFSARNKYLEDHWDAALAERNRALAAAIVILEECAGACYFEPSDPTVPTPDGAFKVLCRRIPTQPTFSPSEPVSSPARSR